MATQLGLTCQNCGTEVMSMSAAEYRKVRLEIAVRLMVSDGGVSYVDALNQANHLMQHNMTMPVPEVK